jgi:DNA-binding CsgD family transcriptional regulator
MTIVSANHDAIQITPNELAQLERGMLGQRQRQLLYRQRHVCMLGTASFALLALFLLALLALKLVDPLRIRNDLLAAIIVSGIAWLWLLRHAPSRWRQINRDLRAGRVVALDGRAERYLHLTFGFVRLARYSLRVGDRRWIVGQAVFAQIREHKHYRIFYAPHSGVFLGAVGQEYTEQMPPRALAASTPAGDPSEPVPELTSQELAILQLIAAGRSNKEIASALSLSVNTIKMYASQLYGKLGVQRRTEAVARARRLGLL